MEQSEMNKDSIQQEQIWIESAKKDPEVFQHIFNKYYHVIYNFVLRRMYNKTLAQDITANTFMKALEKIHQYTFQGVPFSAWLYRIAINEINLHHRKHKKTVTLTYEKSLTLAHNARTDDELINQEEEAVNALKFKKIHKALSRLKPKYQDAITLRYFENKCIKEISEILNVPENTVKTHIHRGLQRLRDLL